MFMLKYVCRTYQALFLVFPPTSAGGVDWQKNKSVLKSQIPVSTTKFGCFQPHRTSSRSYMSNSFCSCCDRALVACEGRHLCINCHETWTAKNKNNKKNNKSNKKDKIGEIPQSVSLRESVGEVTKENRCCCCKGDKGRTMDGAPRESYRCGPCNARLNNFDNQHIPPWSYTNFKNKSGTNCPICTRPLVYYGKSGKKDTASLDHIYLNPDDNEGSSTGPSRGIICGRCNVLIGIIEEHTQPGCTMANRLNNCLRWIEQDGYGPELGYNNKETGRSGTFHAHFGPGGDVPIPKKLHSASVRPGPSPKSPKVKSERKSKETAETSAPLPHQKPDENGSAKRPRGRPRKVPGSGPGTLSPPGPRPATMKVSPTLAVKPVRQPSSPSHPASPPIPPPSFASHSSYIQASIIDTQKKASAASKQVSPRNVEVDDDSASDDGLVTQFNNVTISDTSTKGINTKQSSEKASAQSSSSKAAAPKSPTICSPIPARAKSASPKTAPTPSKKTPSVKTTSVSPKSNNK